MMPGREERENMDMIRTAFMRQVGRCPSVPDLVHVVV
jgi:hypothetical protein